MRMSKAALAGTALVLFCPLSQVMAAPDVNSTQSYENSRVKVLHPTASTTAFQFCPKDPAADASCENVCDPAGYNTQALSVHGIALRYFEVPGTVVMDVGVIGAGVVVGVVIGTYGEVVAAFGSAAYPAVATFLNWVKGDGASNVRLIAYGAAIGTFAGVAVDHAVNGLNPMTPAREGDALKSDVLTNPNATRDMPISEFVKNLKGALGC